MVVESPFHFEGMLASDYRLPVYSHAIAAQSVRRAYFIFIIFVIYRNAVRLVLNAAKRRTDAVD
jgi:hypothetical protein